MQNLLEYKRSNYIKIENLNENPNIYKNENMEAKPIENKIDILKLNIELRLNKYIPENEIKNKIINNMFNDISKINDLKYEYMKKINILNKKEDELISQLNNIKKDKDMNIKCLRKYEMKETKEMITILKISKLLDLILINPNQYRVKN